MSGRLSGGRISRSGADELRGGVNNDIFDGGGGADTMNGGGVSDTLTGGTEKDTPAGHQAFHFIGSTNSDRAAEFSIQLNGKITLLDGDFLL